MKTLIVIFSIILLSSCARESNIHKDTISPSVVEKIQNNQFDTLLVIRDKIKLDITDIYLFENKTKKFKGRVESTNNHATDVVILFLAGVLFGSFIMLIILYKD